MNEIISDLAFFGAAISIIGYELGLWMKKKGKSPIFNPLLISILFVIAFLLLFHIDYDKYYESAKILGYFLTPATVSLAIPLYRQLYLLRKNAKAIVGGIFSGVMTSLISVLLLSLLFRFSHEQYVTLLPKSITTAIGMGVSEKLGGIAAITVASIIVTGIIGSVLAETVFKIFKIEEPVAKGLAIGTSAHAMGTSRAMELGEIEGAMSSLSIVVAGLITVIGASIFANFI